MSFVSSLGCGTIYVYGAYSTQLAERLNLTATETSLIGMTGPVGVAMLGYVAGCIVDKYGMKLPTCSGTVVLLIGYSTLYHCYMYKISSVALLCFALGMAGFGSTLVYQASVKTSAINFPNHRGTAVSVPMSAFGLSAFLFSTLAGLLYPGNTPGFLKLLTILATGLCVLNIPFIKTYEPEKVVDNDEENAPLLQQNNDHQQSSAAPAYTETTPQQKNNNNNNVTEIKEDEIGGLEILKRARYWQHFSMMALSTGAGQMYIYCVGYVARALILANDGEVDPADVQRLQAVQVAIISVCNCATRMVAGVLSDYLKRNYGLQRLWVMYLSLILMSAGHVASMIVTNESHLWVVSTLIGLGYGVIFGIYPTIVSESFGMTKFSQNWGLTAISQVVGSYLFSIMFGKVFDSNTGDNGLCSKGNQCYRTSFMISQGLMIFAGVYLLYIIRSNYLRNQRRLKRSVQ